MTVAIGRSDHRSAAHRPSGTEAMVPARYRVVDRLEEAPATTTLTLEPVDRSIAAPAPGQFTMLWAFGVGEAPISLSDLDGERLIHTIRAVGPVSRALADARIGATIGVRGPFGRGWRRAGDGASHAVVVAGGLGLAPLRPILAELVEAAPRRPVRVLVGSRRPDEILYPRDLERWGQHTGVEVEVTVDAADPGWRGRVGLVTDLLTDLSTGAAADGSAPVAYVCGPELMMWFTARRLLDLGIEPERIEVSLERNMHCAVGWCGHCQLGPSFVCLDGPVYDWATAEPLLAVRGR